MYIKVKKLVCKKTNTLISKEKNWDEQNFYMYLYQLLFFIINNVGPFNVTNIDIRFVVNINILHVSSLRFLFFVP